MMRSEPLVPVSVGRWASICSLCLLLWTPKPSRADANQDSKEEAAVRFDRALRLVNDGDLSGGLAEFHRAYALVPSPLVLYNLGLVCVPLQRPVDAVRWLSEALKSPEALAPEQNAHARSVRAEQELRIGHVAISVDAPEGIVEVDNVEAANLPLSGPLPVSSGTHVIGVVVKGHAPARKEVVVAGLREELLTFVLVPIDGRLAHIELTSSLPGADVYVDDERVGRTPLEASVTVVPGTRRVRISRAGYTSLEHTLVLGDGARAALTLNPVLDLSALEREGGELELVSSEPLSVASVDGLPQGMITAPIRLPAGPHRVRVERGGFFAAERDLTVPLGSNIRVEVQLEPTPSTRASYVERTRKQRRVRGSVLGVSVAFLAAGIAMGVTGHRPLPAARASLRKVQREWEPGSGSACDPMGDRDEASCVRRLNQAHDDVNRTRILEIVGWSVAGAGAAAALVSAVLLWRAEDPLRYERRRAARKTPALQLAPLLSLRSLGVSASGRF